MAKGQIKQKQDNTTYIVYMHIAPNNKKYIGITKVWSNFAHYIYTRTSLHGILTGKENNI